MNPDPFLADPFLATRELGIAYYNIYVLICAALSIEMDLCLFIVCFVLWMAILALRKRHMAQRNLRERHFRDLTHRRRQRRRRQVPCHSGEERRSFPLVVRAFKRLCATRWRYCACTNKVRVESTLIRIETISRSGLRSIRIRFGLSQSTYSVVQPKWIYPDRIQIVRAVLKGRIIFNEIYEEST